MNRKANANLSCCPPARATATGGTKKNTANVVADPGSIDADHDIEILAIPGGDAFVGTASPIIKIDGEGAIKSGKLKPFRMMAKAVTNGQFSAFVAATGYQTDAERLGNAVVFEHFLAPHDPSPAHPTAPWWRVVDAACWWQPSGPRGRHTVDADHPVVQISWYDALAFAKWAGGRLPTEIQWEHAARGGLGDVDFPWGNRAPNDTDFFPCNVWQGVFPTENWGLDGFVGTAPVHAYAPNAYGLYNMVGNTWEWTAESFHPRTLSSAAKRTHADKRGHKTIKGGSFLCHASYCFRYRIAARSAAPPDNATSHQGFRLVFDVPS